MGDYLIGRVHGVLDKLVVEMPFFLLRLQNLCELLARLTLFVEYEYLPLLYADSLCRAGK